MSARPDPLATGARRPTPPLAFPSAAALRALQPTTGLISRAWNWFRERQQSRSDGRRLHVTSTASLGEKRFVAVIETDGLRFLIGGGAANVVLLAELKGKGPFADLLNETMVAKPAPRTRRQPAKSAAKPEMDQKEKRTARQRTKPPKAALDGVPGTEAKCPVRPKAVALRANLAPKAAIGPPGSEAAKPLQMPGIEDQEKTHFAFSVCIAVHA